MYHTKDTRTMIQLAVFDLDGTLMGEEMQIRPTVRDAIGRAQERGVIVTVATGRMFSSLLPYARELGITAPLLAYQGGWIQEPDAELPLYRISLPRDVTLQTLHLADEQAWHTILYADGRIFLREMTYPESFYADLLGTDYQIVPAWEKVLDDHTPDKVLFVAAPDAIPEMGRRLERNLGGHVQIFRSHARFIEVVPLSVDKGAGVAWLAARLGIPQHAVLAVGDQENDAPMVAWAGVGVAMGNAAPTVKAVADWTAPSIHEDGAVAALERYVFEAEGV
jgi:hypothetical protein